MMLNFLWIVPYPEMVEAVELVMQEHENQEIHENLTNVVCYQENIDPKEFDLIQYDAVIARGYAARAFRSTTHSMPVIDIPIYAYDVIAACYECINNFKPSTIAFVGDYQAFQGLADIQDLFGYNVRLYPRAMNYHDIDVVIDKALQDGCTAFVGGYNLYRRANERGLNAVYLKTCKSAILQAHETAVHFMECARQDSIKAKTYQLIAESDSESIIYIDELGAVKVENKACRRFFGQSIEGKLLETHFPQLFEIYLESITKGHQISNRFCQIYDATVSVYCTPVIVSGKSSGGVIRFRNIKELQNIEIQLRKQLSEKGLTAKYTFSDIIHKSHAFSDVIKTAKHYAITESNTLIVGETGTGKELFAQSIHNESNRQAGPFVAVNCAALPESLLESELFGYVEGAFTGTAKGGKMGLFELAHRGTLFLDEISEISTTMQGKLLRVLQEREVRRIGDSKVVSIDVRIISATNRNLLQQVELGNFRQDLLYRLNTLKIFLAPLRQRREDLIELFKFFLTTLCHNYKQLVPRIDTQALNLLKTYDFPGNARELYNIVERVCAIYKNKEVITAKNIQKVLYPDDIEDFFGQKNTVKSENSYKSSIENEEKKQLIQALELFNGKQNEVANYLDINRSTLWRKLKKYGLK